MARLPLLVQAERQAMANVIEHLVEVERRRLYLSQAMSSLARLEPLSPGRVRVEFTAGEEFLDKLEKARQLLSHAIPSGDLGQLMERALEALLEQETRRRFGAGKPRKRRKVREGSRHIPVEVRRAVWERDGGQCTFVDAEGRRCTARRYLTFEHQRPHACGGPPTTDNLCLLCSAHNAASAREVFGEEHIETKIRSRLQGAANKPAGREAREEPRSTVDKPAGHALEEPSGIVAPSVTASARSPLAARDVAEQVLSALCNMGFKRKEAAEAVGRILGSEPGLGLESLLRKCLPLLVPAAA